MSQAVLALAPPLFQKTADERPRLSSYAVIPPPLPAAKISAIPGVTGKFAVAEDYHFPLPDDRWLCIPKGFVTDLASVPRLLWRVLAPHELGVEAPLIHDFLLEQGRQSGIGREEADDVFEAVLARQRVNADNARKAVFAVRLWTRIEARGNRLIHAQTNREAATGIAATVAPLAALALTPTRIGLILEAVRLGLKLWGEYRERRAARESARAASAGATGGDFAPQPNVQYSGQGGSSDVRGNGHYTPMLVDPVHLGFSRPPAIPKPGAIGRFLAALFRRPTPPANKPKPANPFKLVGDPANDNRRRWDGMEPVRLVEVARMYRGKIESEKSRYQKVARETGVPWEVIGVIHMRESSCNFERHLHNGDRLTARTRQVPAGRPRHGTPPFTWEASAIDATLGDDDDAGYCGHWAKAKDMGLDGIDAHLEALERFNGLGYRRRGAASPYLWSGSQWYDKGKYTADGKFDPDARDAQPGVAVVLNMMGFKG